MLLAERPVLTAAVYLICQDPFGVLPKAPSVFFHDALELGSFAFIVCIKTQPINEGVTVHDADGDLRTELCRRFGFSTYDWPDPWL